MIRVLFFICFVLVGAQSSVYASLESITLFVWTELEPLTGELAEGTLLTKEEAAKRILEETRVLVSAMIYGYEFTYTPPDAKRNQKEEFVLTPISDIPWGDARLKIVQADVEKKILRATVRYTLDTFQAARRAAWKSASIPSDAGRGEATVYAGYRERLVAFKKSILDAVRNYLRRIVFNKPREVRGEVLLEKSPSVVIDAGLYVFTSVVKINIREIIPYIIF
jgi:hypothetical protein